LNRVLVDVPCSGGACSEDGEPIVGDTPGAAPPEQGTFRVIAAADALAEDVRRFVHPRNIPDSLAAYWAVRRGGE